MHEGFLRTLSTKERKPTKLFLFGRLNVFFFGFVLLKSKKIFVVFVLFVLFVINRIVGFVFFVDSGLLTTFVSFHVKGSPNPWDLRNRVATPGLR